MINQNLINYVFFSIIFLSYILGFYLDEDSAGGGKVDLIEHEWGNYLLFKSTPLIEALTSLSYESSRTPLFLIIHKYNFFINSIEDFRFVTFLFGFIIFYFFCVLLKKKFKNLNLSLLLLISSLILLSPYFRSSVYWANQEHLAIFFFIISLISFEYCKVINFDEKEKIKYYFFAVLSSFLGFLSFYSDQKFFFLAPIIYFYLINKNSVKFFVIFSSFNFLFFLPTIYLFFIWGGIVPIESQFRLGNTPSNINIFISNIGIYFIPLFIIYLYKNKFKFPILEKKEFIFLVIFSIILYFILPKDPSLEGSGIIFRLLSVIYDKKFLAIEWEFFRFLYFLINIFFIYLATIFLRASLNNLFILFSFSFIFYLTYFSYQSYVDPIFLILLYSLFDVRNIKVEDEKVVYINLSFYSFILVSSILFRAYVI